MLLSEAVGILHRDAYPAEYAKRRYTELNSAWNKMLKVLDEPFTVQITEDASIITTFPQGTTTIEKASGGQQCCAAIAYLLAINRLYASKVGLLVLDEPTYGPDADHIGRIRELFSQVQNYAGNNGMQILVVTHENRLQRGFNHLIELPMN
jgi:DNA repair exonuclease SbcCD ATPase subunit